MQTIAMNVHVQVVRLCTSMEVCRRRVGWEILGKFVSMQTLMVRGEGLGDFLASR